MNMNIYEIFSLLFSGGTFLLSFITYLDSKYKK